MTGVTSNNFFILAPSTNGGSPTAPAISPTAVTKRRVASSPGGGRQCQSTGKQLAPPLRGRWFRGHVDLTTGACRSGVLSCYSAQDPGCLAMPAPRGPMAGRRSGIMLDGVRSQTLCVCDSVARPGTALVTSHQTSTPEYMGSYARARSRTRKRYYPATISIDH